MWWFILGAVMVLVVYLFIGTEDDSPHSIIRDDDSL